ncbi:invasion protein regulator [Paracoccaceae bacterium]|jgi:TolB-like protein
MDASFGPFQLKRQDRQLLGPDGPVDLSARAFDLLVALLDHPGEIVSKDELFVAVWPGVVVEENTLQVHISALRKALPDGMIATVHGRGYRYAGPEPERFDPATQVGNPHRGPLIVVLPFANLGGDPDQQYFSDGITQDITDRLTRFQVLSVIAVDSALAGQGPVPDVERIRAATDANFVISGSVRRSDSRIRISVRLTDAATRAAVWAEQYDRPLADIYDVQDEVADMVAATISQKLEIELASRTLRMPPSSLKSYDLMLRGVFHYLEATRDSNDKAIDCFERALAEDPNNFEALGFLGVSKCQRYEIDFDLEAVQQGLKLIERQIKMDQADARPFVGYSIYCAFAPDAFLTHAAEQSRAAVEHALRLNPNDYYAIAQRAAVAIYEGEIDVAREWLAKLKKLTSHALPWVVHYHALIAFHEGRYREALPGLANADFAWQSMYQIACYGHLGEPEQAQAVVARFAAQGRVLDFHAAAVREAYSDAVLQQQLIDGVRLGLQ